MVIVQWYTFFFLLWFALRLYTSTQGFCFGLFIECMFSAYKMVLWIIFCILFALFIVFFHSPLMMADRFGCFSLKLLNSNRFNAKTVWKHTQKGAFQQKRYASFINACLYLCRVCKCMLVCVSRSTRIKCLDLNRVCPLLSKDKSSQVSMFFVNWYVFVFRFCV